MKTFRGYVTTLNRSSHGYKLLLSMMLLFLSGCGVKGDPLPPEKPPVLGRGQPTYREATEEFFIPGPPKIVFEKEDEKNLEDEELEDEDEEGEQ